MRWLLTLTVIFAVPCAVAAAEPSSDRLPPSAASTIDQLIAEALEHGEMAGAVLLIDHRGETAFQRAYGHRQLEPTPEVMTVDTVFDLASLTKPIVTATCVLKLVEMGRIQLHDPVAAHIPKFATEGKDSITILDLLLHQGGLVADNPLDDYQSGVEIAVQRICALKPVVPRGERFIYSDVGFIVLGLLVERVSKQSLDEFAQQEIFEPLGMESTAYNPPDALRARAATTHQREGRWMRGEVHDPRAYLLGGVAGHAGLFSTAEDLLVFSRMLMQGGQGPERRVLEAATVELLTAPHTVPGGHLRSPGWDIRSSYSSNRGDGFSTRAFGHGGFTGTVLWIDPELELVSIFLSNRLHPDGEGSVNRLAGRINTIVARAVLGAE